MCVCGTSGARHWLISRKSKILDCLFFSFRPGGIWTSIAIASALASCSRQCAAQPQSSEVAGGKASTFSSDTVSRPSRGSPRPPCSLPLMKSTGCLVGLFIVCSFIYKLVPATRRSLMRRCGHMDELSYGSQLTMLRLDPPGQGKL
jgi:hypothetical protein